MMESAVADLERLLGAEGAGLEDRLAALPAVERSTPRVIAGLRKRWAPELVSLALRFAEAGDRQHRKFPSREALRFTPELLEQASAHPPAAHRARRFADLGPVLDLGCGAGGDLTRLAAAGAEVIGLEADPLAAALASSNLAALGLPGRVIQGRYPDHPLPDYRALFVDPARREGSVRGRRHRSSRDFSPSPEELAPLLAGAGAWALKWGPALDLEHEAVAGPGGPLAGLDPADYELELVSWNGELREALFLGGEARSGNRRQATRLVGPPESFETWSYTGDPARPDPEAQAPREWIHEPDPALIRSGLLGAFAGEHGLAPLAPGIAYFTATDPVANPFLRRWRLLEAMEFSLGALQSSLDRQDAGSVVLKKRGFPVDPETLRGRLRLNGEREITVLIYRDGREHRVCVCESKNEMKL
jgi:SAM-dependent methyltransferase